MYDVIIIGFGPAGCTAGIFAVRRNLKTLILSDPMELSQAEQATVVDDWPGDLNISGYDLVKKFREHTKKLGVEVKEEKVTELVKEKSCLKVKAGEKVYDSKTIIISTGAKHRKGMIKGEDTFAGKGVSYCASCDAPLYKGKKVLVLGGGDSALSYALLLEQVGVDTTLIHRRDEFRGAESWVDQLKKSKVKTMLSTMCLEIKGDTVVRSAVLMDKKTQKKQEMKVDGIFVAFGAVPTSEIARKTGLKLDERGYIIIDRHQKTNVDCVYAAGDCTIVDSKKIVVAAGAGAVAAESAYNFIKGNE